MQPGKEESVCAYKMLLNFDGKTFLLKLQLHEELCRWSVVGRGLLLEPNFWLRAVSHLCISWHLLSSVKLSVGLQSPGLSCKVEEVDVEKP